MGFVKEGAIAILIFLSGLFTLALGLIHIFLPTVLGYKKIMFSSQENPNEINIKVLQYKTKLKDLYGIIWVMNHHASYVLISIGVVDIFLTNWLLDEGKFLCLWIAGWWLLRSLNQLYLGKRRGDIVIMTWFLLLALIHFGGFIYE